MIPMGYLYKKVASGLNWRSMPGVKDCFALSGCISPPFADYLHFWRHNGYYLFDQPDTMAELAQAEGMDLQDATLFYYEVYEYEYLDDARRWGAFLPDPACTTRVLALENRRPAGFDVACFSGRTAPECSPLSCNMLGESLPVNRHCLFDTLEAARAALERGAFRNCEPGPYRIIAVYQVDARLE